MSRHDKPKLNYHEAAEHRTVTIPGWVCLNCDRLYPDSGRGNGIDIGRDAGVEHLARWCCTHQSPCRREGCTALVEHYTLCNAHRAEADAEKWAKARRMPWHEGTDGLLYDEHEGRYYEDADDALDALVSSGRTIEDAVIVLCSPNYARSFELSDHVYDDLPEDGEVPDSPELHAAAEALNKALEALGPLSWSPTTTRWDGTIVKVQGGAPSAPTKEAP